MTSLFSDDTGPLEQHSIVAGAGRVVGPRDT
jgi:hypothetical protein